MDSTTSKIPVTETPEVERPTGLEDVTRSLRGLLRSGRRLTENTFDVAERELAMAISISEQMRDGIVTEKALRRAREEGVSGRLRQDAHRTVDLLADAGAIAFVTFMDFLEGFADTRRPPLPNK
jgi:hypothetical protein